MTRCSFYPIVSWKGAYCLRADGLFVHTTLDEMKGHLICYGSLILATMVTCQAGTEETCAELEFPGFRHGQTVKVLENSYANVTFYIKTLKCTKLPEWFRLKVSYHQGNFNVDVCSMIFMNSPPSCDVTEQSAYCRCVSPAGLSALLYKQFNHSGNISYLWSWSDSFSGQTQKKAQIMFDVTSTATTRAVTAARETSFTSAKVDLGKKDAPSAAVTVRTPAGVTSLADQSGRVTYLADERRKDGVPTSPGTNDKIGEAVNLHAILINSLVTACVIGIPIIIVFAICIYIYKRKRASVSGPAADGDRRQEPEISTDQRRLVQAARPPSRLEDAEYMEIDDTVPTAIFSAKVHEHYEHPVQDDGKDDPEYSQLEYKCLWRRMRGQGKDAGNKQERAGTSGEIVKVSQTAGIASAPDLPDDYLEPVPSSSEKPT